MCDNMYGLASVLYRKSIYFKVVVYKVDYTDVKRGIIPGKREHLRVIENYEHFILP